MMPDPYSSTREDFTKHLTSIDIPDHANATWRAYAEPHRNLLELLAYHEAMAPNLQQTYMTPANSKNKIYFMWDFMGRTLGYIILFDPSEEPSDANHEIWSDVMSRSAMSKILLVGDDPSKLEMMLEMQYPDQRGRHPEIGEEILTAAKALP